MKGWKIKITFLVLLHLPVSLLWPKMCLSTPSSPLSLCSIFSIPSPKPSIPPISTVTSQRWGGKVNFTALSFALTWLAETEAQCWQKPNLGDLCYKWCVHCSLSIQMSLLVHMVVVLQPAWVKKLEKLGIGNTCLGLSAQSQTES